MPLGRRKPADYQEILSRARRDEPEHAAVAVLHADDPRPSELARVALGDARIVALRAWWEDVRKTKEGDDITWRMVRDAADALKLHETNLVGNAIAVDLETGIELLEKIDELFPKVDEGEDEDE